MSDTKVTVQRKPRGRPRSTTPKKNVGAAKKNTLYMSYEDAREYLRGEMLPSSTAYQKWWDKHKPATLSKYPYRVYKDSWVSWNDYLGTNNKFESNRQRWRPYDAAVQWAQTLGLETENQWKAFAASSERPEDIPIRPDLVYRTWTSWNYWLGYKPADKIKASQAVVENLGVYYIIHNEGHPTNVLTYGIENQGLWALKKRWEREPYEIIRFFKYDPSKSAEIQRVIMELTTEYQGEGAARLTPNVWEVLWYLSELMDVITDYSAADKPNDLVRKYATNDGDVKPRVTNYKDLPQLD